MRRRDLALGLVAASVAAPRPAAVRQAGETPVVGVLLPFGSAPGSPGHARLAALERGLADQGYGAGRHVILEARWLEGRSRSLEDLARELVDLRPAAIVTQGEAAIQALRRVTTEVPIVVAVTGDLVVVGHAASHAEPGGNVTGLVDISPELSAKRLQLVTELRPGVRRIGVLWNAANPVKALDLEATRSAARGLGLELVSLAVTGPRDLEPAFAASRREGAEALLVLQDNLTAGNARAIMELAARHRLPTVAGQREFAEAGGLLSYGANVAGAYRRAASFVHRILQGAEPGDLPIERPTEFELVVNLRAARALGLDLPPAILLRADEVVE